MAFFRPKFAKINNEAKSCCIFQFAHENNKEYFCAMIVI
jgi:hypothetical protein